ncbi:MAG: M28 family metallopeptidase [Bacteroidales bacterium]
MKHRKIKIYGIFLAVLSVLILISGCKKYELSSKEINTIALTDEISGDTLESYVKWMEAMGTRFALAGNHRQVAVAIRERFKKSGYYDARLDSFFINVTYNKIDYNMYQYNVIAELRGSIHPDSVTVLGAHYDNILKQSEGNPFIAAYGANDNAGGVAAVLEIARVMKKRNYQPAGTIMFIAFGAEELGLLGSKYHADMAMRNFMKIKFMLNNDMIAYQPNTDKANWYVNIADYDNSHPLRIKAEELSKRYTVLKCFNDNTYRKQSDSYSYFLSGFKALFFASYVVDPNYHTINDISEACNFEFCREIVKLNCALLVERN